MIHARGGIAASLVRALPAQVCQILRFRQGHARRTYSTMTLDGPQAALGQFPATHIVAPTERGLAAGPPILQRHHSPRCAFPQLGPDGPSFPDKVFLYSIPLSCPTDVDVSKSTL